MEVWDGEEPEEALEGGFGIGDLGPFFFVLPGGGSSAGQISSRTSGSWSSSPNMSILDGGVTVVVKGVARNRAQTTLGLKLIENGSLKDYRCAF